MNVTATSGVTGGGSEPNISYDTTGGSVVQDKAATPNEAVDTSSTGSMTDSAQPVISSSATTNSSNTADTTKIDVTFTESVSEAYSENFSVSGNVVQDVTGGGGSTLTLSLKTAIGRGATPEVTYTQGVLQDSTGNLVKTASTTPSDGVSPVLTSIKWTDQDGTGGVSSTDTVELVFAEPMNENTITTTNADSNLSETYDPSAVSWSSDSKTVTITLGSSHTITKGTSTEDPGSSGNVLDKANNAVVTASVAKPIYSTKGPVTLN